MPRIFLLVLVLWGMSALLVVLSIEPQQAWAQDRAVEGQVRNAETGEPISGVNVVAQREEGMQGGAGTDAEGQFRIEGKTQKLDEKPAWLGTVTAIYDLLLGFSLLI